MISKGQPLETNGRLAGHTSVNQSETRGEALFVKSKRTCAVTIAIVTFNSKRTIGRCLDRLLATLGRSDEVVLVDNASNDRTTDVVQRYIDADSRITCIVNSSNIGYAAAANQAAKTGSNPLIVFLNPDTIVTPHWIDRLADHLISPTIAAVGPLSDCVAGLQHLSLYLTEAELNSASIEEVARRLHDRYAGQTLSTKLLIGFCMMIKRSTFESMGGMDENLFLGNDDLDLSWRLRQSGYELVIAKDTVVLHEGQASFSTQPKTLTDRLVQESTDFLSYKLLGHYNHGNVPTAQELWSIDWFKPTCRFARYKPLTSLIVLTYNQLEYTTKCIESIIKHTDIPYELIIVDNGSTDGSLDYLRAIDRASSACVRIHVVANDQNTGFAHGCNQGLLHARGQYLMLLNNDVVVTRNWLTRLLQVLEDSPRIGMVGPMTNHASGLQQIDSPPYDTGSLDGLDRFAASMANQNKGIVENHWRLAGFCLLVKRRIIETIGGFDLRYKIGNFEDDDFCIRAHLAGFQAAIAKACYVHHFGGQTFLGNRIDYNRQLEQNWQRFKMKWGIDPETPYQQKYHVPLPQNGFDKARHYVALVEKKNQRFSVLLTPKTDRKSADHNSSDKAVEQLLQQKNQPGYQENQPIGGLSMSILDDVFAGVQKHIAPEHKAEAAWILARIVESDPGHGKAHHELGLLYYEMGDHANAQPHLQKAVELCGNDAIILKDLGDFLHVVNKDAQGAQKLYEKAIDLKPNAPELLITLAHLCTTQQDFEKAADYCRKVVTLDPANDQALACLRKIEARTAKQPTQSASPDLYARALSKINADDRLGALTDLDQLLHQNPNHALAHNDSGVLLYEQGDKQKALEHYQHAVRLAPDNTTFLKNLADYYWVENQDAQAALECYVKVLHHSPKDLETLLNCGQICLSLSQTDDAESFIEQALQVDPDNQTAQELYRQSKAVGREMPRESNRDALYGSAQTKAASGDISGAISDLTQLITHAPTDDSAYNDLGVLHYEAGNREKALACYQKAVELNPHQETYLKNLADFYLMEQGRAQEAMEIYVKVLEKNPLDIDCLFASGAICAKLEKADDARMFFDRVLEIEPNHAAARQSMKQLDQGSRATTEQDASGGIRLIVPHKAVG